MEDVKYVPFEPGIGSNTLWQPPIAFVRRVDEAPEAAAVKTARADEWFAQPAVENLTCIRTGEPADPPTRVAMMRDDRFLLVAFECAEPRMDRVRRLVPAASADGAAKLAPGAMSRSLVHDDHVAVYLDAAHHKATYCLLQVNLNGARLAERVETHMSWTALPVVTYLELGDLAWDAEAAEGSDRWRAAIRVDLQSVGIDPAAQPTVGVNLARTRVVDVARHYFWAPAAGAAAVPALAMGDAYLAGDGAAVGGIDWGDLEYGDNRVRLSLLGGGADRDVRLTVAIADADGYHSAQTGSAAVKLPAGGQATIEAPFELPHQYPDVRAELALAEANSDKCIYRASYPIGSLWDLRLSQPYRRAGKNAPEPLPTDSDFHVKKVRYILSRLPRFCRRTTAQGGSSDFVLAAADGSVEFDLMKAGALKRIADWVCSLFAGDDDRLAAAALLTNDDWVTVHALQRVGMQAGLTPLSQLRLGGGHCYSRSSIAAGIVREMPDPATGKNHQAWPVLVVGHVVTAVRRGDDYVYIDPTFGHFFYNKDNTALATARQLAADESLVARVVKAEKRLLNYRVLPGHVLIETGTIVWPAGAPPQ